VERNEVGGLDEGTGQVVHAAVADLGLESAFPADVVEPGFGALGYKDEREMLRVQELVVAGMAGEYGHTRAGHIVVERLGLDRKLHSKQDVALAHSQGRKEHLNKRIRNCAIGWHWNKLA
jgi:hypothetical protein